MPKTKSRKVRYFSSKFKGITALQLACEYLRRSGFQRIEGTQIWKKVSQGNSWEATIDAPNAGIRKACVTIQQTTVANA